MTGTLFDESSAPDRPDAPLAARMRPRVVDEVVGQAAVLAEGTPLQRLISGDGAMTSVVLWGPPGSGKTTLASLIASTSGRAFVELSAVTAGVKDVRAVVERARDDLIVGTRTVLFVDEVHRFSKTQQDALLPAVENGWVTLVAATTENPSFAVIAPLLSRSLVVRLAPLDDSALGALIDRALTDERGLGGKVELSAAAREAMIRLCAGDARRALTVLEAAAQGAPAGRVEVTQIERAVQAFVPVYDRAGDAHYDVTSALIKSIRGSDVDAALHYLARMTTAGEDPRFIARRLVILASEDIGMADPSALQVAMAAMQAVSVIGMPEARLTLAQAVIHLSLAPKSNSVIAAIDAAEADVRAGLTPPVPAHLRDAHYPGAKSLGHGDGYLYPHNDSRGVVGQQYAPDGVGGREYYQPTTRGAESDAAQRHERLRHIIDGE